MKPFERDFDELLNDILTDWRNQFPEADISQGSLIFMKSACLASALWGLYKHQSWIAAQIFPDTADAEALEHHAWVRGLSRKAGETDQQLLERLLEYLRRPPMGGSKYDFVKWALEVDNVAAAWCIPLGQGAGSADVIIVAAEGTGSEIPSSHARSGAATDIASGKLIDNIALFDDSLPVRIGDVVRNTAMSTAAIVTAVDSATQLSLSSDIFTAVGQAYEIKSLCAQVKEYIDEQRLVTAKYIRVLPPAVVTQDITMTGNGANFNKAQTAADIAAYINTLIPGQALFLARLTVIAVENGAEGVTITAPAEDVTPGAAEIIRPGAISVT